MVEIGDWTKDHFGDQQADAYLEVLIAQCKAVAGGTAHVQSCGLLIGADLQDDLRFTRAGQHYVVFIETAAWVSIVDFVHQREDLAGKMRGFELKR